MTEDRELVEKPTSGNLEALRRTNRCVVLGGAGFLGTWLVRALLARGAQVTVVDQVPGPALDDPALLRTMVAQVDAPSIIELLRAEPVDTIFHLAGPSYAAPSIDDPHGDLMGALGPTIAVLEAIRASAVRPTLVYASSATVYGEGRYMPMDESHPVEPISPYGVSKLASEEYLRLYSRAYGIPTIAVRLFSMYGPGQRKQVVHDLARRLLGGERELVVLGTPDVTRDLLFVGDAAEGFVILAENADANGQPYNLCSGTPTSLGELAATLVRVAGSDTPVRFSGSVRPGDPLHWHGDPSKARSLGARSTTELEDGLRQTVEWLRQNPWQ